MYRLFCHFTHLNSLYYLTSIFYENMVQCMCLGKFIQTFTNTTSVESSLEAAADEMAENEDKLASRYKG